jgi:hypothetical protein
MSGKSGSAPSASAKALHLLHELGVLDLVERAGTIGQLHRGLELAVAAAGLRRLPLAGLGVQALDQQRLAAGAARGRQVRHGRLAGDRAVDAHHGDGVDQRIDARKAAARQHRLDARARHRRRVLARHRRQERVGARSRRRRGRGGVGAQRRLGAAVEHRLLRRGSGARTLAGHALHLGAARGPGPVRHQRGEHDQAQDQQSDLQGAHVHAASASDTAASMSTATMRDTPCSCMVTPISCSAISIAILLCEMNRNCVFSLMLRTSLE